MRACNPPIRKRIRAPVAREEILLSLAPFIVEINILVDGKHDEQRNEEEEIEIQILPSREKRRDIRQARPDLAWP